MDPTPTATEKWRSLAACRGSDVGLFYPDGTTPNDLIRLTCATCDVRAECLTDAVAHRETFGLWGGAAGDTLRKLTRKFTKRSHADPSILDDCECEWCKGARAHFNALDEMRFSETERYRSPFPPDLGNRTHGHASTYGVGCRCEPCRLAKAYEDNMRRTA